MADSENWPGNTVVLTVEYPNVTLCYKVKMDFLNPIFNQIRLASFVIQLKYGFFEILQVLWCIPVEVTPKLIKNSQNDLLHAKVNV